MPSRFKVGDLVERKDDRAPEGEEQPFWMPNVFAYQVTQVIGVSAPKGYLVTASGLHTFTVDESQLIPWQGTDAEMEKTLEVMGRHQKIQDEVSTAYDNAFGEE